MVGADVQEMELYSGLISETVSCHVDIMTELKTHPVAGGNLSHYHLVVVDLSSQKVKPLKLIERIKRSSPSTGVVLLSDSPSVHQAVESIRHGAEDFLEKPFSLDAFKLAIKRGLDRKEVFSSQSALSDFFNLINACQFISSSLEERKVLGVIRSFFKQELQAPVSEIYKVSKDSVNEEPKHLNLKGEEDNLGSEMNEMLEITLRAANPFQRMIEDEIDFEFIEGTKLTPGLFVFRFHCVSRNDFFCVCLNPETPASEELFRSKLGTLSRQIQLTGRNIEQYMGVQNLIYRDEVTGLFNTRYLDNILDEEIKKAKETQKPFAVLFIDADRFKQVNDGHGHLVGSSLLNELGSHIKSAVRNRDTVFRYGGDEFITLLTSCDLEKAKEVAERIRTSVEKKHFLSAEGLNLQFTVSIGIALYPDHAQCKRDVIDMADHAMYEAKKHSRNTVFLAGGSSSVKKAKKSSAA